MANSVLTNTAAMTAHRNLGMNSASASQTIAKLSSGRSIVRAADDAAGNAIATQLNADIKSLGQALKNASQGSSLIEVANGSLGRINDMLTRMKTLATQSNNDTLDSTARSYLQKEFAQLTTQVNDIATKTRFNGQSLLDGGSGTVTVASAAVAAAVVGETAAATSFDADPATTGFVDGVATAASVTKSGGIFNMAVTVGNQTFTGSALGLAGDTTITLASTTNSANTITLVSGAAVMAPAVAATAVETALKGYLGVGSSPAHFTSAAIAGNTDGESFTATAAGSTSAGKYSVTYTTGAGGVGTLTLQDSYGHSEDAVLSSATDLTHTFTNGVTITLGANGTGVGQFDQGTTLASPVGVTIGTGTGTSMNFQVGEVSTDTVAIAFTPATSAALGLTGLGVDSVSNAAAASTAIDSAIGTVVTLQADLGAIQSRFDYISANLSTLIENSSAVMGSFQDMDMAQGQIDYIKSSTLADAAIQMLAQANMMPQKLMKLLQ
jgi:flagellin